MSEIRIGYVKFEVVVCVHHLKSRYGVSGCLMRNLRPENGEKGDRGRGRAIRDWGFTS